MAADVDLVDRFERAILHLEDFPLSDTVPKNRILARKGYRIRIVDDYLIFYCVLDCQPALKIDSPSASQFDPRGAVMGPLIS